MKIALVLIVVSAISAATTFAVIRTTGCPAVTADNPGLPLPLGPRQQVTGGQRF
jgi:hypothetical protein